MIRKDDLDIIDAWQLDLIVTLAKALESTLDVSTFAEIAAGRFANWHHVPIHDGGAPLVSGWGGRA